MHSYAVYANKHAKRRAVHAPARLQRQNLYWCTSKASKLRTSWVLVRRSLHNGHCCCSGVSICSFVLVKQVN
jgi:hypothetical protein